MKIDPAQARERPTGLDPDIPPERDWMARYRERRRPLAFVYDRSYGGGDTVWYLVLAAAGVSVAAIVVWFVGIAGDWGLAGEQPRSGVWAGFGGTAVGLLVASRITRNRTWRLSVGGLALMVSVLLAVAIWHHVGLETFPKAASALGFAGMVGLAVAVGLWVAVEFVEAGQDRRSAAVLVVAALLLAGTGLSTIGWSDRSLDLHRAHSPLPAGPAPATAATKVWTLTDPSESGYVTDGSQLYSWASHHGRATVTAIDPATGRTRWSWSRPAANDLTDSQLMLAAGSGAAAVELEGRIIVLDARTGRTRFTVPAPPLTIEEAENLPTRELMLSDGMLIVQTGYGVETTWSLSTGGQLWQATVPFDPNEVSDGTSPFAAVAATSGIVGSFAPPTQTDERLKTVPIGLVGPRGGIRRVNVPAAFTPAAPGEEYHAASYRSPTLVATDGVLVGSLFGVPEESLDPGQPQDPYSLLEFAVDPVSGRVLWDRQVTGSGDDPVVPAGQDVIAPVAAQPNGTGGIGLLDARDGHLIRHLPDGPFTNLADIDDNGDEYPPLAPSELPAVAGRTAYAVSGGTGSVGRVQTIDLVTGQAGAGPAVVGKDDVVEGIAALPGAIVVEYAGANGPGGPAPRLVGYR